MLFPRQSALALALAALTSTSCGSAQAPLAPPPAGAAPAPSTCLPGGDGYLRARLRGAFDMDIAWRDAEMQCEGGPRPDGRGIRVSIAGPAHGDGHSLRFVFGIAKTLEGEATHARAANVTVIFEGEKRIFATRGDDKCTIDRLTQQRVGPLGGPNHQWRIEAHGFCVAPATAVADDGSLLIARFDFAGRLQFPEASEEAPPNDTPG
ncbi:MAG: hypothetical protein R3E77_02850 [Steroidobacteraceae bacterium]